MRFWLPSSPLFASTLLALPGRGARWAGWYQLKCSLLRRELPALGAQTQRHTCVAPCCTVHTIIGVHCNAPSQALYGYVRLSHVAELPDLLLASCCLSAPQDQHFLQLFVHLFHRPGVFDAAVLPQVGHIPLLCRWGLHECC